MANSNGNQKRIRVITEPGAFGQPGLMIVVRRWLPKKQQTETKKLEVESFTILDGDRDAQLEQARELRKKAIVEPAFCSFTVLEFVEETRKLVEPKPEESKIIRPDFNETNRFGRSKYMPDGS